MYPFDKCATLGEKQSICEVSKWATELHNPAVPRSVLCADSYYLDNAARSHLMNEAQPFLCSIKSDGFKALTARLQEKVRQPGE